jgi:hypothetical protein
MTRALLCLFLGLAACGGGDAPATTPASSDDPGETSAEEPAAAEEPGATEEPISEPAPAVGCDKEVALTCESGFKDGCLTKPKLTVAHVCVADSEKKAGPPPCKMEIARQCPDGQVDACLSKPRLAKTHVCVVAPK